MGPGWNKVCHWGHAFEENIGVLAPPCSLSLASLLVDQLLTVSQLGFCCIACAGLYLIVYIKPAILLPLPPKFWITSPCDQALLVQNFELSLNFFPFPCCDLVLTSFS